MLTEIITEDRRIIVTNAPTFLKGHTHKLPTLEKIFTEYHYIRSAWSLVRPVQLSKEAREAIGIDFKESHRRFIEEHGITAKSLQLRFNAKMNYMWGSHPYFSKLCIKKGMPVVELVRQLWEMDEEIQQAEQDGIENVIPLIHCFGMSPSNLKRRFGAADWKKLSKNSFSRNKMIAPLLSFGGVDIDIPSTLLRSKAKRYNITNRYWRHFIAMTNSYKEAEALMNNHHKVSIVCDTISMGTQLGFSPMYRSYEKYEKKHEEFRKEINARRYSGPAFVKERLELEIDGYFFYQLVSPQELADEGVEMHHCIASYLNRAIRGEYLVFKIGGAERATLGINVDNEFQVKGRFNVPVSKELEQLCRNTAGHLQKCCNKSRGGLRRA